jgi:hypothetical protein
VSVQTEQVKVVYYADGLKLFAKEEFEPDTPNRFLFF